MASHAGMDKIGVTSCILTRIRMLETRTCAQLLSRIDVLEDRVGELHRVAGFGSLTRKGSRAFAEKKTMGNAVASESAPGSPPGAYQPFGFDSLDVVEASMVDEPAPGIRAISRSLRTGLPT